MCICLTSYSSRRGHWLVPGYGLAPALCVSILEWHTWRRNNHLWSSRSMKVRLPRHEVLATGLGDSSGLKDSVSTHGTAATQKAAMAMAPKEVRIW